MSDLPEWSDMLLCACVLDEASGRWHVVRAEWPIFAITAEQIPVLVDHVIMCDWCADRFEREGGATVTRLPYHGEVSAIHKTIRDVIPVTHNCTALVPPERQ